MSTLPAHIAIIPDGNRRWATRKGLPTVAGHQAGAKTARIVLRSLYDAGVRYGSMWGASLANVQHRPPAELSGLFLLFETLAREALHDLQQHPEIKIQVRIVGEWEEYFPESAKAAFRELMAATAHHTEGVIQILLAYDGQQEMVRAANAALVAGEKTFTKDVVKKYLSTHDMPPVDFVVRTGCENDPHWSNGFMMWDVAEAQLYFSETLWPDFDARALEKALAAYAGRERRLGK